MSLDERLRDGLGPLGVVEDDALERVVGDVVGRGHRRRLGRKIAAGAVSVAIAAAGLVVLPRLSGVLSSGEKTQPSTESAVQDVSGTYRAKIAAAESRALKGTWVVTLFPDGSMWIVSPPHFNASWDPPRDGTYQVDGNELRIDAFTGPGLCRGVGAGTYSWSLGVDPSLPLLDGQRVALTLTPIDEDCEARRLLLTGSVWRRH